MVQFGVCLIYFAAVTVRCCVLVEIICVEVVRCLIVCVGVSVLASTPPLEISVVCAVV